MLQGSAGQILLNEALPEDLRDYSRVLDKKGVEGLFRQIAHKYPDRYKAILQSYMDLGADFAGTKGVSVSLRHMVRGPKTTALVEKLRAENQADIDRDDITDKDRNDRIVARTSQAYPGIESANMEDQKDSGSPLYTQVISGGRGNPAQLNQITGAELLVADHRNRLIPMPIYSSYADGLDPAEYWASTYGTRRGIVSVKFATPKSGFLGKQLSLAAHRQVVNREKPTEHRLPVGLPVAVDDEGNSGAVLAKGAGEHPAGTILTPRILSELKAAGVGDILIHSPMTSADADGGVDSWSAGVRDRGELSKIGDNIGVTAAQALSEPLSQGALSEKHSSGAGKIGKKMGGFDFINKLLQGPEFFAETGPLSPMTGHVKSVDKAPQGGHVVTVGDHELYVRPEHQVTVKPGDRLDMGDEVSDGIPHPADLVKYRGIGEARRVFLDLAREVFKASGVKVHRRNIEPIVAGLLNHVQITDPDGAGDHIVDDIVPYNRIAATYTPRDKSQAMAPQRAVGRYLEEPALHYSVGTPITKRVATDLDKWGIQDVISHEDAPGFAPQWERLMTTTTRDPDWQTRLSGFYTGRALLHSVHEGATSDSEGGSFFPAVAQASGFGDDLTTKGRY